MVLVASIFARSRSLLAPSLLAGLLLGCARKDPVPPGPAPGLPAAWRSDAVAAVNGVLITRAEVSAASKVDSHQGPAAPEPQAQVVERLVREELATQRAVELGLDQDPAYREKLAHLETQVVAFRRERLSEAFYRDAASKVEISDADARKYFDEHGAEMRREIRVSQILMRDEAAIEAARRAIEAGTSFEDVARKQFPELPEGSRPPWDLGYLRWNQVPEAWAGVVERLAPGQTSAVIRGPNRRFWLVKLVDRRENPAVTFESVRSLVTDKLRAAQSTRLRDAADQALRARARIVYGPGQGGAPAPPR